jgi:hypothetical protein
MFTIEANGGRLSRADRAWSTDSHRALVALVEAMDAEPAWATATGPQLPVDWADERWAFLLCLDALADLDPEVVEAPDFGDLGTAPDGAVS